MAQPPQRPVPPAKPVPPGKNAKKDRLARALRENLARRKAALPPREGK